MFKKGEIVKHERFMDVAIKVIECIETSVSYSVKCKWINQGFNESGFMGGGTFSLKIPKDGKWLRCVNPSSNECFRYCQWEAI